MPTTRKPGIPALPPPRRPKREPAAPTAPAWPVRLVFPMPDFHMSPECVREGARLVREAVDRDRFIRNRQHWGFYP